MSEYALIVLMIFCPKTYTADRNLLTPTLRDEKYNEQIIVIHDDDSQRKRRAFYKRICTCENVLWATNETIRTGAAVISIIVGLQALNVFNKYLNT